MRVRVRARARVRARVRVGVRVGVRVRVRVRERRGDTGQQDHDELDDVGRLHSVDAQAREDHLVSIVLVSIVRPIPMVSRAGVSRAGVSMAIVSGKPYLDVGHGDVAERLEAEERGATLLLRVGLGLGLGLGSGLGIGLGLG